LFLRRPSSLIEPVVLLWFAERNEKSMAMTGAQNTMHKHELIIYWSEEDLSFVVEVPELPGCMADGPTYHEAVANAEKVIEEWIETAKELGRQIPVPRGGLRYA
jgi:predicted RNase H-like HicB family nuclease